MWQTMIRKHSDGRYPVAGALWAVAGVILLLALGDVVIVLAFALAAAAPATAWWIRRNVEHRARNPGEALASISRLPTGQREPKSASAHPPWNRHDAA